MQRLMMRLAALLNHCSLALYRRAINRPTFGEYYVPMYLTAEELHGLANACEVSEQCAGPDPLLLRVSTLVKRAIELSDPRKDIAA